MDIRKIAAAETRPLRQQILRPHQTIVECVFEGDEEPDNFHLGAYDKDELVAIASVFRERETRFNHFSELSPQFRLRGMATLQTHRSQGYGSAVLHKCLDRCWSLGGQLLWCNARTSATDYYKKLGFVSIPSEFELPGIGPHRVMFVTNRSFH